MAISLSEAETIRYIMHRRIGKALIAGSNLALALRCLQTGFTVFDASHGFLDAAGCAATHDPTTSTGSIAAALLPPPPPTHASAMQMEDSIIATVSCAEGAADVAATAAIVSCPFMTEAALESLRFLNCEFFFPEKSINILLRALHGTSKRERRSFFKHILACRRRLAKKLDESTVAKLFKISDLFAQLKQRAQSVSLRSAIRARGMLLYDAFSKFNASKNGLLTPAEM